MRIGELSRRTGVSERLLRYYEEQGLLRPARTSSGYRAYGDTDVELVDRIRNFIAAGISTATIARILPCLYEGDQRLVACSELPDKLLVERARIDNQIDALHATRAALDTV